jgi:hypothetical protein
VIKNRHERNKKLTLQLMPTSFSNTRDKTSNIISKKNNISKNQRSKINDKYHNVTRTYDSTPYIYSIKRIKKNRITIPSLFQRPYNIRANKAENTAKI